jgi:hypothetical protein
MVHRIAPLALAGGARPRVRCGGGRAVSRRPAMTTGLYTFQNGWRRYRCQRNKRNTINQLRFEVDAEANLLCLQQEQREHRYR